MTRSPQVHALRTPYAALLCRHVLSKADIRADDLSGRLPAPDARWHCRVLTALISNEEMRLEKRVRSDLQLASRSLTVAGAAQVGTIDQLDPHLLLPV